MKLKKVRKMVKDDQLADLIMNKKIKNVKGLKTKVLRWDEK